MSGRRKTKRKQKGTTKKEGNKDEEGLKEG